jgi:hypothetical protein
MPCVRRAALYLFFSRAKNRKANLMAVIVIFVEGADTEPDLLPVYFLDNQDHATLICEGLKESEYRIYNFSMMHCTRSDRGRFAVWAKMAIDARDGVYGNIAAGIYNMIDEAHAIISQRRVHQKSLANSNGKDQSDDVSVLPSSKRENPTKTDDQLLKEPDESPLPKYDPTNSADWILSETLCNVIGIKASTITEYRKPRKCGKDRIDEFGSWNTDCVGKFRRNVNSKGSVAYYRPSMSDTYKAKLAYAESQKINNP